MFGVIYRGSPGNLGKIILRAVRLFFSLAKLHIASKFLFYICYHTSNTNINTDLKIRNRVNQIFQVASCRCAHYK